VLNTRQYYHHVQLDVTCVVADFFMCVGYVDIDKMCYVAGVNANVF
jgi:hypothetical protein